MLCSPIFVPGAPKDGVRLRDPGAGPFSPPAHYLENRSSSTARPVYASGSVRAAEPQAEAVEGLDASRLGW